MCVCELLSASFWTGEYFLFVEESILIIQNVSAEVLVLYFVQRERPGIIFRFIFLLPHFKLISLKNKTAILLNRGGIYVVQFSDY